MIRLDLSNTTSFTAHRSGWQYCMSKLRHFHSRNGILFNDFIEKDFSWNIEDYYNGSCVLPYRKNWVGVWHNPPISPDWFDIANSPQAVLQRDVFQESLKTCKAIVCLSEYLSSWLRDKIDVPIVTVMHPTEVPRQKWNIKNYTEDRYKYVVQLGYWLRKLESIHDLRCDSTYKKIWLPGNVDYSIKMFDLFVKTTRNARQRKYTWSGVDVKNISNEEFDRLLSKCVVLVNLYDSSANNAVIECVARNTPLLVNRLPAVEEYLGKDYPLYINDLDHATSLLYDIDKLYEAHLYLKNMDKRWISGTYFANTLITKLSSVIQDAA
jgi:hypothetical protein